MIFVKNISKKPEYVLASIQLITTLAMQAFLLISKHYGAGSFVFLTQMYFYGFAFANIILALQHVFNQRENMRYAVKKYGERSTNLLLFIASFLFPPFTLQFFRQSSLRFGDTKSVPNVNWQKIARSILGLFAVTAAYPFTAKLGVSFAYAANGAFVYFLLSAFSQFFRTFQIPKIQQTKANDLFHILPDIVLIISPIALITICTTFLTSADQEKYLSVLLSTAITGVVSSVLQGLAIRNSTISFPTILALFAFAFIGALGVGILVVGPVINTILFIQMLAALGLCQGYFVKWFRAGANLMKKMLFCFIWLAYLSISTIIVGLSRDLSQLYFILAFGYVINLAFSVTSWNQKRNKT